MEGTDVYARIPERRPLRRHPHAGHRAAPVPAQPGQTRGGRRGQRHQRRAGPGGPPTVSTVSSAWSPERPAVGLSSPGAGRRPAARRARRWSRRPRDAAEVKATREKLARLRENNGDRAGSRDRAPPDASGTSGSTCCSIRNRSPRGLGGLLIPARSNQASFAPVHCLAEAREGAGSGVSERGWRTGRALSGGGLRRGPWERAAALVAPLLLAGESEAEPAEPDRTGERHGCGARRPEAEDRAAGRAFKPRADSRGRAGSDALRTEPAPCLLPALRERAPSRLRWLPGQSWGRPRLRARSRAQREGPRDAEGAPGSPTKSRSWSHTRSSPAMRTRAWRPSRTNT